MLVINLLGSPGAGKSTGASYIFSKLKAKGISVELVTEFAKDLVYEGDTVGINDQPYIFGEQNHRLVKLKDKVEFALTDSPILLSCIYSEGRYPPSFVEAVTDIFNTYDNLNYYIQRTKPYSKLGRYQTEEESRQKGDEILNLLESNNIPYKIITGDRDGYKTVVDDIVALAKGNKEVSVLK